MHVHAVCVCVCVCMCVFQHYVSQHLLAGPLDNHHYSQLTLTTVTRLDSLCQAQDATQWYHLTCTNLYPCEQAWGEVHVKVLK